MNCKKYNDISYSEYAANDIKEALEKQGFNMASACLTNLIQVLNISFRDVTDETKIMQMNQKLEHMMQVVEDSLYYVNKEKHYAQDNTVMTHDHKEIRILNAILHDTGRIFEIACLGTSGKRIDFNHSLLGGEFLRASANTKLLDNSKNELPTEKVDEFLVLNLKNSINEEVSEKQLQGISRLKLLCLPYNINKLKTGNEHTAEEIVLYGVTHHGDRYVPKDCSEGMRPFLNNIRITDRIANLMQGMKIAPELITGGKNAEQIATMYQPVDIDENEQVREGSHVIDDLTYHELTTGAKDEDGKIYYGVNRGRKIDEEGKECTYTPMRMFLSRVGWIYADDNDMNFYRYCKESHALDEYCDNVKPFLKQEDRERMEEIQEKAREYINNKIIELSNVKDDKEEKAH